MGAEHAQETSCHVMPSHVMVFVSAPPCMNDCPLAVSATAATSKSSTYLPEPGRAPAAALPNIEKQALQPEYPRTDPFLHNRGSTHLQCCVFLI